MFDQQPLELPPLLPALEEATAALGFSMASDRLTGSFLRTLAASRPGGILLELGTGTGIGSAWLLHGMDRKAHLHTVERDPLVVAIARDLLGDDSRVTFHLMGGVEYLAHALAQGAAFDLIFADSWPGKYIGFDDALRLLKPGGFYVIDDMLPQPNWPDDHAPKVAALLDDLARRRDLWVTRLGWSTGLVVVVKRANN